MFILTLKAYFFLTPFIITSNVKPKKIERQLIVLLELQ